MAARPRTPLPEISDRLPSAFGGAARQADVVAPGGTQRVEWEDDSVYLTGWAEILVDGDWLRA